MKLIFTVIVKILFLFFFQNQTDEIWWQNKFQGFRQLKNSQQIRQWQCSTGIYLIPFLYLTQNSFCYFWRLLFGTSKTNLGNLIFLKIKLFLFTFALPFWDQSHVTIVWNTRETGDIDVIKLWTNYSPSFFLSTWGGIFLIQRSGPTYNLCCWILNSATKFGVWATDVRIWKRVCWPLMPPPPQKIIFLF